ncbi:MAG: YraN family protein [Acidimicrobiales bacterium]
MTHERLNLGRLGEDAAAAWYKAEGYHVAERNFRSGRNEIDLVCIAGSLVVFVEVKTRTTASFGGGAAAVGYQKQRRVRRVAAAWLSQSGRSFRDIRFDVVESDSVGTLTVWPNAF